MELKKCTKCGQAKPPTSEHYNKSKNTKDRLQYWCRECKKINHQENRDERIKLMSERYRKLNPIETLPAGTKRCSQCKEVKPFSEFGKLSKSKDNMRYECNKCRKEYYMNNQKSIINKSRKQYNENKEWISERNKKYKEENKEWYREYHKKYYQENMEEIKENVKQYHYKRMEEDIGYKILQRCRSRLYDAIKGYVKSKRTIELIGCSVEYLLEHLEKQFTDGMTWDNYGEWHIDHIKPCAMFDFTKPEHQRECFHYTNLQPLWAEDNFKKAANYEK